MTKKKSKCLICSKPAVEKYDPFCSERCKTIDLGGWLGGQYRMPSSEPLGEGEIEEIIKQADNDS